MIQGERQKEEQGRGFYSAAACIKISGVSASGYYSWRKRQQDPNSAQARRAREIEELEEKFRAIIHKIGYVPGKRTFKLYLFRECHVIISVKRCSAIMKHMNLFPNRPKKDAYKGGAKHYHVCCARPNYVAQNFKQGPREVILTDITYLYYGPMRTPCYLCAFKDAYTNEILGYAVDRRMTVELVKKAYDQMMAQHKGKIKTKKCYVHSDQGSQYLSIEFQELLKEDGIIQSMSARGNSQDNAPMESFFSRMKTESLDIIARCPKLETVQTLMDGYVHFYNHERYQNSLAGLTPNEYYRYVTTGIYPLDSYFGVKSTELMSVEDLVAAKIKKAEEKSKKTKRAAQKKREEKMLSNDPLSIILRDQKKLNREKKKWEGSQEKAEKQIQKIQEISEKALAARQFYATCSAEVKEELKNPLNWKKYPELDYVNEITDIY